MDMDTHMRALLFEQCNCFRYQQVPARYVSADRNRSSSCVSKLGYVLCRLLKVSHDSSGMVDENFGIGCEANTPRPPFKKRGSQSLFDLAQSPTDHWLGYVEMSRSTDDAALFRNCQHQDEVANFERPVEKRSDVHGDDDMPV